MKRVAFMFALLVALRAVGAEARDDRIELYPDLEMSSCTLTDTDIGFKDLYVFHNNSIGSRGSHFRVPTPACWVGATYIASYSPPGFLLLGQAPTDMQVHYEGCLFNSIHIATIRYFTTGAHSECCEIRVEPAPSANPAGINVLDCDEVAHEALAGERVLVNPDQTCPCDVPPPPPPDLPDRGDKIALYADEGMSNCRIVDDSPGIRSIHMFHTGPMTAMASEFSVPKPDCWQGAVWISDTIAPPSIWLGNSQTDLSIAYTECRQPPIYLGSANFYTTGLAQSCCHTTVHVGLEANPSAILVVDCGQQLALGFSGTRVVINPDATCACDVPVTTQETTWGRIKAMYH